MGDNKTLSSETSADPRIAELIGTELVEGKLPCAAAFRIADTVAVPPQKIGESADVMGIRLCQCQLGFFGYPNKQGWDQADLDAMPVPEGLETAIKDARNSQGDVSCAQLWMLAEAYGVSRLQIGYVADQVGVHITPCQLGAF